MYRSLKTWKTIDIAGQVVMLAAPVAYYKLKTSYAYENNDNLTIVVATLFTVGGWQTLSFLIHLTCMRARWIAGGRRGYNILYLVMIFIALLCAAAGYSGSDNTLFVLLGTLALVGPVMAVLYFGVSVRELNRINRLALDVSPPPSES